MKKADKPEVVIIEGDHNKVSFGGGNNSPWIAIVILAIVEATAVLAIRHCCPELLADFVRWMIGTAMAIYS